MEIYRLNYKVAKKATEAGSEYKTLYVKTPEKAAEMAIEIIKANKLFQDNGITITPTKLEE